MNAASIKQPIRLRQLFQGGSFVPDMQFQRTKKFINNTRRTCHNFVSD
jgi:hypothetical protein